MSELRELNLSEFEDGTVIDPVVVEPVAECVADGVGVIATEMPYEEQVEDTTAPLSKDERKEQRRLARERKKEEARVAYEEKVRRQGHGALWYLSPAHLKAGVAVTGENFSFRDNVFTFIVFAVAAIILGILNNMDIVFITALTIVAVMFVPGYIVQKYRRKYEEKRFADINIYMEQFLYAFREHKNIARCLKEIRTSFGDSGLGRLIDEVYSDIMNPDIDSNEVNVEEVALRKIERVYPTEKLKTIHKFALRAERIGGDFDKTSSMLLEDRANWEAMQNKLQLRKKQNRTMVNVSIIFSMGLCTFFLRTMGQSIEGADITKDILVQGMVLLTWVLNLSIFSVATAKTYADQLSLTSSASQKKAVEHYYRITRWNNETEFKRSMKYIAVFAVATITMFFLRNTLPTGVRFNTIIVVVLLLITIFMSVQHRVDYALTKKKVEEEIMLFFPQWLIDIALLLQTDNVQVAIYKSFQEAPEVLQPELKKLYDKLQKDPTSVTPYLEFFDGFEIKGIQSSMKMLYNVYNGTGSDSDIQIKEIIQRNNELLEVAADAKHENQLGEYAGMLLLPILTAGAELAVDMTVFFNTMLAVLSNTIGTF